MIFRVLLQYLKNYSRIVRLLLVKEFREFSLSVKKNDVCLDLGANVGDITLLMWFRGAKVYAIEASPIAYNRLLKRCKYLKKVVPLNLAVAHTNGTLPFYLSKNIQSSTLCADKSNVISSDGQQVDVQSLTLDTLLLQLADPVTFVKCDIEGAEYLIQDDLLKLASQPNLRLMLIECHANKNPQWQSLHDSFVKKVNDLNLCNVDLSWH